MPLGFLRVLGALEQITSEHRRHQRQYRPYGHSRKGPDKVRDHDRCHLDRRHAVTVTDGFAIQKQLERAYLEPKWLRKHQQVFPKQQNYEIDRVEFSQKLLLEGSRLTKD